jgi:C4-dicarboxylate-binding protein DctP
MTKRIWQLLVITFIVFSCFLLNAHAEKKAKYVWNITTVGSEASTLGRAEKLFCELVNYRSKGTIKVTPFYGGALGNLKEGWESLQRGDLAILFNPLTSALGDKRFDVNQFPYLCPTLEDHVRLFGYPEAPFHKLFAKWLKEDRCELIAYGCEASRNVLTIKKPVHKVEDLTGLKLRIPPVPMWIDFFGKLGVKVTPMAYPEVYNALQTGIIDGMENPISFIVLQKFYEPAKNLCMTGHAVYSCRMIMTTKRWNSLPADLQQLVKQSAHDAMLYLYQLEAYERRYGLERLKELGVKITYMPKEEKAKMRKAAMDILPKYSKSFGHEATDLIKKVLSGEL